MNQPNNLRDQYIQLVETFITALESGRSGAELEDIRKEIRILSDKLGSVQSVENPTQDHDLLSPKHKVDESNEAVDTVIS